MKKINSPLSQEFSSLPKYLGESNSSSSIPIGDNHLCFLCKSEEGAPFFLIRSPKILDQTSFKLKYLTINFDIRYLVEAENYTSTDNFIRVSCVETREDLYQVFIDSVASVLENNQSSDPVYIVQLLIELFTPQKFSKIQSIEGLWGELLFIDTRRNIDDAILAWHIDPNQLRDFIYENFVIEVKTTLSSNRKHIFNLNQISQSSDQDLLCSILIEKSDHGKNLSLLAEMIASKCSTNVRHIFWRKFLAQINSFDDNYDDIKFDYQSALNSIEFFPLNQLNCPVINDSGIGVIQSIHFELLIQTPGIKLEL